MCQITYSDSLCKCDPYFFFSNIGDDILVMYSEVRFSNDPRLPILFIHTVMC